MAFRRTQNRAACRWLHGQPVAVGPAFLCGLTEKLPQIQGMRNSSRGWQNRWKPRRERESQQAGGGRSLPTTALCWGGLRPGHGALFSGYLSPLLGGAWHVGKATVSSVPSLSGGGCWCRVRFLCLRPGVGVDCGPARASYSPGTSVCFSRTQLWAGAPETHLAPTVIETGPGRSLAVDRVTPGAGCCCLGDVLTDSAGPFWLRVQPRG